MEDRRSIRSKRAIREAFLGLLQEREINKITIADLCRRADLGRGTFYLHYKDVYDLFEQIESELLEQLGTFYTDTFPSDNPVDFLSFMEKTTEYLYHNRSLVTLIIHPQREILSIQKFKDFFNIKVYKELQAVRSGHPITAYDEAETTFLVSGVVGVLEKWVGEGMSQSPAAISALIHQILLKMES